MVESYSGWRDLASLLRSKPPVAIDPRIRQAIALMRQDLARELGIERSLRTVQRAVEPLRRELRAEQT
mgnify:CR=1 FL=1